MRTGRSEAGSGATGSLRSATIPQLSLKRLRLWLNQVSTESGEGQ